MHDTGVLSGSRVPCSGVSRPTPGIPHTCPNGGGFQCAISYGENSAGRRFELARLRRPASPARATRREDDPVGSRQQPARRISFTRAELKSFTGATLPDLIAEGVRLLFVGINPGLRSVAVQGHFAPRGNRFYPALLRAGITDHLVDASAGLTARDRDYLLGRGIGITSLVARATASADELGPAELAEGARTLAGTVRRFRPHVVAVLGVTAYRAAFGYPRAVLGRQPEDLDGAQLWVVPNPSGRNAHAPLDTLAAAYRGVALAAAIDLSAPRQSAASAVRSVRTVEPDRPGRILRGARMTSTQHVRVEGTSYQRGRQYGRQAAARVRLSVQAYQQAIAHFAGWDWGTVRREAARFEAPVGAFRPAYLDEMRGIADGAGLELGRAGDERTHRGDVLGQGPPGAPGRDALSKASTR